MNLTQRADIVLSAGPRKLSHLHAVSPYGLLRLQSCPLVKLKDWTCLLTERDTESTLALLDAFTPPPRIVPL